MSMNTRGGGLPPTVGKGRELGGMWGVGSHNMSFTGTDSEALYCPHVVSTDTGWGGLISTGGGAGEKVLTLQQAFLDSPLGRRVGT